MEVVVVGERKDRTVVVSGDVDELGWCFARCDAHFGSKRQSSLSLAARPPHLRSEDRRAKKWLLEQLTTISAAAIITVAFYTNNSFHSLPQISPHFHSTSHHHHVPQKIRSEHAGCGQAVLSRDCQNPALRLRLTAICAGRVAKTIRHEDVLGCARS